MLSGSAFSMGRMTAFTRTTFRAWQAAGCGLCILCEINFHQQNKAIFGWRQGASGNPAEWAGQQELALWVQSSGLCFCPRAGGVLGPTSGRSNVIVNVKANFLEDCFISLVNVPDSCRVTRKQPRGWLWLCWFWHSIELKEGKGQKKKRIMLALEKKRSLLLFVWTVFGSSRSWSCKAGQRNLGKYCPWSPHWKLPEPWRYRGVYLEAVLCSGPSTSISAK